MKLPMYLVLRRLVAPTVVIINRCVCVLCVCVCVYVCVCVCVCVMVILGF
jgi:hypothetical protein